MFRRSLTYNWTEQDRVTRFKWMRRVGIFYGCIALFLFAIIAIIKPSNVASNGTTDRTIGSAGALGARVVAMPTVSGKVP